LSVSNESSLYSSTQNFIIFKVLSTTSEYDLITIPRIFDPITLAENAVKQDYYYNRTKITSDEGIEVYDNLNNKVLQMGGITVGSNPSVKDAYGFKVEHSDGTFSAMIKDGFIKKSQYGESYYLNDIETFIGTTIYQLEYGSGAILLEEVPLPCRIYLPTRFRNKDVKMFLSLNDYEIFPCDHAWENNNGDYGAYSHISTILKIADYKLNVANPYIDVEGYSEHVPWYQRHANNVYGIVTFLLMVIAN